MTVSLKDSVKFFGIIIMTACAALLCNMFLNYDIDLRAVGGSISAELKGVYDALLTTDKAICLTAGGCLVITSVIMLVFYIGQYIENHSAKFGILKALGYPEWKIALTCAVFGVSVFIGVAIGVGLSWAIMSKFYSVQNTGELGVEVVMHFHAPLFCIVLIVPPILFAVFSFVIALIKLRIPALSLIRGITRKERPGKVSKAGAADKKAKKERSFLSEVSLSTLSDKKVLAFFIAFGGFCFSAMLQMGLSIRDYANEMLAVMMIIMGVALAAVSLYLALSTVIAGNAKKIAMLKVNGYSQKECGFAVLGLYRIPAYAGFVIGSVYQYVLLSVVINVLFSSYEGVEKFSFNWVALAICVAVFAVIYEALTAVYTFVIGRRSVKSVMSE